MHYLVTIDRDEWLNTRKWEVWKKQWWEDRFRPRPPRLGRTVFVVDRQKETCSRLFELPQYLDDAIYKALWRNQEWAGKAFTRGLRTLIQTKEDTFVLCDMFGVYETDRTGNVRRYLSLPIFNDLHSALPNADNTRILLSNTITEEVLEVGWDGTIYRRVPIHKAFRIGPGHNVEAMKQQFPDHRLIPLDSRRELFHLNWAEWLEEGKRMLVSFFVPGMVAILKFTGNEECCIERKWTYFPRCHAPAIDFKRGTLLVAVSAADQVMEVDMETGKPLWIADNIRFGKSITILDDKRVLVGDCNGRRLVELNRDTGRELWSHPVPGIPYDVEVLRK